MVNQPITQSRMQFIQAHQNWTVGDRKKSWLSKFCICCHIQMLGSEFGMNNVKAWLHPALYSTLQVAGGGVTLWGRFSWRSLKPDQFTAWMFCWQICSNCWMLSCQYGPKSQRNIPNTLLDSCHQEWMQFWRLTGEACLFGCTMLSL